MARRELSGNSTGIGGLLRAIVQPQAITCVSRDPFLRHFRPDFYNFVIKFGGQKIDKYKIITASAGDSGYLDLFLRREDNSCILDINGQPSRVRKTGKVEILSPRELKGCPGCVRKATQSTVWWPE